MDKYIKTYLSKKHILTHTLVKNTHFNPPRQNGGISPLHQKPKMHCLRFRLFLYGFYSPMIIKRNDLYRDYFIRIILFEISVYIVIAYDIVNVVHRTQAERRSCVELRAIAQKNFFGRVFHHTKS